MHCGAEEQLVSFTPVFINVMQNASRYHGNSFITLSPPCFFPLLWKGGSTSKPLVSALMITSLLTAHQPDPGKHQLLKAFPSMGEPSYRWRNCFLWSDYRYIKATIFLRHYNIMMNDQVLHERTSSYCEVAILRLVDPKWHIERKIGGKKSSVPPEISATRIFMATKEVGANFMDSFFLKRNLSRPQHSREQSKHSCYAFTAFVRLVSIQEAVKSH